MRKGGGIRAGLVAGAALLALAGACGVPSHSGAIIDGPQLPEQPAGALTGGPEGPAGALTPADLISRYLTATAVGSIDTAIKAAKAFMTPEAYRKWLAGQSALPSTITIIRAPGLAAPSDSSGGDEYTIDAEVVGMFDPATGVVDAPSPGDTTDETLAFKVAPTDPPRNNQPGLLSAVPPRQLFLVESTPDNRGGLQQYFERHTIYFWDQGHTRLVAQDRYLPKGLSDAQQEAKIVNWILRGPEDPTVNTPVSGVTLRDPTVATVNNQIVINLSTSAHEAKPDLLKQLVEQIAWSFGPALLKQSPIQLEIDDQPDFVMNPFLQNAADFQRANLAALRGSAVAYAIAGGVVYPLETPNLAQPDLLRSRFNTAVLAAAITADQRFAAFVRPMPGGGQGLWVRRAEGPEPKGPLLTGRSIKFPSWVMGPQPDDPNIPPSLAVLVDGALELYDGTQWQMLRAATPSKPLSSFSVSPEGSRVAMTIGGALSIAMIGTQGDRPALLPLRDVFNIGPLNVDIVAWRSEVELVIGVRDHRKQQSTSLVYIDGTNYDGIGPSANLGTQAITQIAAFASVSLTASPVISPIMVQPQVLKAYTISQGHTIQLGWGDTDIPTQQTTGMPHGDPTNPFYAQ